MGKRNKTLPVVEEWFHLWQLGLPFREYHGIDELNEKLKLQAFMVDGCYGDEDEIKLGYDTSEIRGGFYIFVLKGSLDKRLRALGVASPGQHGLTESQLLLRLAAKIQIGYFTNGEDWRTVTTTTGIFRWGPERPSFASGAVVFLTPRDCPVLEHWCRTEAVQLQSKHAVVSAEYMQVFATAMRECEACVPPGSVEGREKLITRRRSTIYELSWFAAPQYSEFMMRVRDVESHNCLRFAGTERLLKGNARKEQNQAKCWRYTRHSYRVESWAGTYLTVSMRF